jgi:hypothetical protein
MSLKSGVLFSLFSGVSFADLQRASTRSTPQRLAGSPSPADVAYATRFAGPAQVSTGAPVAANDQNKAFMPTRDAA